MADIIDDANDLADLYQELQIKKARAQLNVNKFEHTGFCINCEEVVKSPRIFCDGDCRDDFERRKKYAKNE
jgi:hypothetical protein